MQQVNFPWELIIADDFSTDGTREIILEYYEKYPNLIKLILQKENVGASRNWLDLISSPKGKLIALCEGDDYWTNPQKLQKQVDFLCINSDYSMCCHASEIIYEDGDRQPEIYRSAERDTTFTVDYFLQPMSKNIFRTESVLFRYEYFQNIPDWFDKIVVQDYPLFLWLSHHGKIRYLNQVMSVYRRHSRGLWNSNYVKPDYNEKYYLSTIEMYQHFDISTMHIYHSKINKRIPYRYYQMIWQFSNQTSLFKKYYWKYFWKLPIFKRGDVFYKIYIEPNLQFCLNWMKTPFRILRKYIKRLLRISS